MIAPYEIRDPSQFLSPSLIVFRDLVRQNLEAMIAMAGSVDRLRPHVKTHKMPEMVRMVEGLGITKHKCATIAEAEMVALAGGRDVLIAYPLVGPNVKRLVQLVDRHPETTFRATVESAEAAGELSEAMSASPNGPLSVLLDLDIGMGRTGVSPGAGFRLYRNVANLPGLSADGLHAYDGQIKASDPILRASLASVGVDEVLRLRDKLVSSGFAVPRLVLGGTPSFPIHAALDVPGVECSAGTAPFFDTGYGSGFPDLPFVPAALILTRVISGPRGERMTLDLGHKAVAADPKGDRLTLLGVRDAVLVAQSEEHLIVESSHPWDFPPGTPLLAIPTHVCPTCALHAWAYVVEEGELVDRWEVSSRNRVIAV